MRSQDDSRRAAGLSGGSGAPPSWWKEALRLKDDMTLKELASELAVPVSTLSAEFRKQGVSRRIKVEGDSSSAEQSHKPPRRSGSKDVLIEQYFHLLGNVPDSEVARMAGVSVRTIASYRARNEIDGYNGPRRRPQPRGRRESKVDDYKDLLGIVPDRVIADVAGMSLGAVRNFRIKCGVEPAGRMRAPQIEAALEAWRAGGGVPSASFPPEPTALARPVARAAARPRPALARVERRGDVAIATRGRAWRVSAGSAPFVIIAESMERAVARAVNAAGDERRIQSIEYLGEVLDAR